MIKKRTKEKHQNRNQNISAAVIEWGFGVQVCTLLLQFRHHMWVLLRSQYVLFLFQVQYGVGDDFRVVPLRTSVRDKWEKIIKECHTHLMATSLFSPGSLRMWPWGWGFPSSWLPWTLMHLCHELPIHTHTHTHTHTQVISISHIPESSTTSFDSPNLQSFSPTYFYQLFPTNH